MQNKLFGTDGIRGTANVEPMTAATALKGGMAAGSLCGHGQLGWNPVQSALRYFPDDFSAHMEEKRCVTGQCAQQMSTPQRTRSRWSSVQLLELKV